MESDHLQCLLLFNLQKFTSSMSIVIQLTEIQDRLERNWFSPSRRLWHRSHSSLCPSEEPKNPIYFHFALSDYGFPVCRFLLLNL